MYIGNEIHHQIVDKDLIFPPPKEMIDSIVCNI